jgi:hypothetical protein
MRVSSKLIAGAAVLAAAVLQSGSAFAGQVIIDPEVPAPGILGLVALGVIAAIAVARHRK